MLETEVTPVFQREHADKLLAFEANPWTCLGWNRGSIFEPRPWDSHRAFRAGKRMEAERGGRWERQKQEPDPGGLLSSCLLAENLQRKSGQQPA